MNTKLRNIENWEVLAEKSKWSASLLAKQCGVSVRTLHRHFQKTMGVSTKIWLEEQRQLNALLFLRRGYSIKETAAQLGYKQSNSFSRHFKSQTGMSPTFQKNGKPHVA